MKRKLAPRHATMGIALLVGLAVAGGASALAGASRPPTEALSAEQAMARAAELDGIGAPKSVRANEVAGRSVHEVDTENGLVWIDRSSGLLVGAFGPISMSEVRVLRGSAPDRSEGQAIAAAFSTRHHPEFDKMELIDVYEGNPESWTFSWRETAPSGALLPRLAIVSVDRETGLVTSYHARNEGTVVDANPTLEQNVAEERMRGALGEDVRLSDVRLLAKSDCGGRQRLVWHSLWADMVGVGDGEYIMQSGMVFIDAETGEDVTGAFLPDK